MPWTVWIVPASIYVVLALAWFVAKRVKDDFDRPLVWILASMVNTLLFLLQVLLVVDWYHSAGACERFSESANVETKLETYGFFKGRHCFVNMGDGTWIGVDSYKGINEQQ